MSSTRDFYTQPTHVFTYSLFSDPTFKSTLFGHIVYSVTQNFVPWLGNNFHMESDARKGFIWDEAMRFRTLYITHVETEVQV